MAKMEWKSVDDLNKEKLKKEIEQEQQEEKAKQNDAVVHFLQSEFEKMIANNDLSTEQKNEFLELYDPFEIGNSYEVGKKVKRNGIVYEVIQAHTAQADWLPKDVPALFNVWLQNETTDGTGEGVEVINEWKQPVGGHDAYAKGDKVYYDNQTFESIADSNVWSPDAYGWTLVI